MARNNNENVLVIGDLHTPFDLDDYFTFCKEVKRTYKTNHTIFIGDVVDSHASSYHESDPDGLSAGDELEYAIKRLQRWHKAFPNADVIIGNHCRIAARKVFSAGLSKRWLKPFADVLEIPTWTFHEELTKDGVLYVHGEGVTARTKAQREGCSVVQGHRHTEGYTWFTPQRNDSLFGMQVGCGVDSKSYAMAYGKHYPSPVLGCGVVLNNGKMPIFVPM